MADGDVTNPLPMDPYQAALRSQYGRALLGAATNYQPSYAYSGLNIADAALKGILGGYLGGQGASAQAGAAGVTGELQRTGAMTQGPQAPVPYTGVSASAPGYGVQTPQTPVPMTPLPAPAASTVVGGVPVGRMNTGGVSPLQPVGRVPYTSLYPGNPMIQGMFGRTV